MQQNADKGGPRRCSHLFDKELARFQQFLRKVLFKKVIKGIEPTSSHRQRHRNV